MLDKTWQLAFDLYGSNAENWFRTPHRSFNYLKPIDIIVMGYEDKIIKFLEQMQ